MNGVFSWSLSGRLKGCSFLVLLFFLCKISGNAQIAKARQYQNNGEYEMAMKYAREALEKKRTKYLKDLPKYKDDPLESSFKRYHADDLKDIARIFYSNAFYSEAVALQEEALEIYEKSNSLAWTIMADLAKTYIELGEFDKASRLTDRVAAQFTGLAPLQGGGAGFVYWNTPAQLYLSMGQVSKAERYLDGLKPEKSLGQQHYVAQKHYLLTEKITMYLNQGMYGESETTANAMHSLWQEARGDNDRVTLTIKAYLAHVYALLANFKKAQDLLEEVEAVIKAENITLDGKETAIACYMGMTYFEIGQQTPAEKYLALTEDEFEDKNNRVSSDLYVRCAQYLSVIEDNRGNHARAGALMEKAYAKYVKKVDQKNLTLTNDGTYLELMYYRAEHFIRTKEISKAEEILKQVAANRLRRSLSARAEFLLAQLLVSQGKYDQAYAAFKKSIGSSLRFFQQSMYAFSEKERSDLLNTIKTNIDALNQFAADHAKEFPEITSDIYNFQLTVKSLLLRSSIQVMEGIRQRGDVNLIRAAEQWKDTRRFISNAYALGDDEIKKRGIDLNVLETKLAAQERELSQKVSAFNLETSSPGWKDIQTSLGPTEAAIEMIRIPPVPGGESRLRYAALILTKNSQPVWINLGEGERLEKRYLKFYRGAITFQEEDKNSYEVFWKPMEKSLTGINRIYFSPDGVYNAINPATLFRTETKKYIGQTIDFRVVTSTADLTRKRAPIVGGEAWLFGAPDYTMAQTDKPSDDQSSLWTGMVRDSLRSRFSGERISELPGTLKEVETIRISLSKKQIRVTVLTAGDASEESVRKVRKCRVLHLATHGFFEERPSANPLAATYNSSVIEQNPLLYSGLLLAGAQNTLNGQQRPAESDGVLTAFEVLNLDLSQTELVVLSACETGLGKVVSGEGVYGLPRAFRLAGTESVLMSLWKVDDEATKQLMSLFYRNWLELGMSKQSALKAAQTELQKKFKNPYYWGAFILLGVD